MKKQIKCRTFFKLSILAVLLFSSSKPATFGLKVDLSEMKLELAQINATNFGILIWDQRIMVTDLSQPESFMGYKRSLVGIAYPYQTKSERPLTELMSEKIKNAYHEIGIETNTVMSSASDTEEQINEKIKDHGQEKVILIKLNELHFDGAQRLEYVVDIDVSLVNSAGTVLLSKNITKKIPLGNQSKYKKTVPDTLKSIFEEVFNSADLINALEN